LALALALALITGVFFGRLISLHPCKIKAEIQKIIIELIFFIFGFFRYYTNSSAKILIYLSLAFNAL
ncbi:hypothetical protein, partial [Escherichia coli]